MENNEKKQYIAPKLICVTFMLEAGFTSSLTQNTRDRGNYEARDLDDSGPFDVSFGSYGNNNDDWD